MKQHLLKDGSPGTPRRARAAERSPASASAREMGGERHAPSGPWRRRASCRDAQCSRSSAGSKQEVQEEVLSRREPPSPAPLGSCLPEVARPWSAASRDTSADSRCASGGERIITVPITVIYI